MQKKILQNNKMGKEKTDLTTAAMRKAGVEPKYDGLAGKIVEDGVVVQAMANIRERNKFSEAFLIDAEALHIANAFRNKKGVEIIYRRMQKAFGKSGDADMEIVLDYIKQKVAYLR